jgi:hypothetical protein
MRQQDSRQRIQRNRAIAVQAAMIMAGLGIGTFFLVQAIRGEPEGRDFNILAAVGCYGVGAFYIWLQVRRWRREKRVAQMLAERQKRKQGGRPAA